MAFDQISKELDSLNLSINKSKQFVISTISQEVEDVKKEILDLGNISTSPILKIDNITNSRLKTFLITYTHHPNGIGKGNVFFIKNFCIEIHCKENLSFPLGDIDIDIMLSKLESEEFNQNSQNLENIFNLIQFGVGEYRFYQKIIQAFIRELIKAKTNLFNAYLLKFIEFLGEDMAHYNYHGYIFLRELSGCSINNKVFNLFQERSNQFHSLITKLIISILSYYSWSDIWYLKDFILYLIHEGKLNYKLGVSTMNIGGMIWIFR